MYITSQMTPGELLAYFLDLRGVVDEETEQFRRFQHNDDLCPGFYRNVDALVTAYCSYRTAVWDVQGPTDQGVDVLLCYRDAEGEARRSALQIKSFQEFASWSKRRPMTETLLAQHSRARNTAKIDKYYIVCCTDLVLHRDRIRQISAAFMNYEDVKVIVPTKALPFFVMSEQGVSIEVTRVLCSDDPLFRSAQVELENLTDTHARMLIHLVCRALGESPVGDEWELLDLFESVGHSDGDRAAIEALSALERANVIDRDSETFTINVPNLPVALCALYFEQKYRSARWSRDLEHYLNELLIA
jgi:hypothetical protein